MGTSCFDIGFGAIVGAEFHVSSPSSPLLRVCGLLVGA